mmetsp:Transcript_17860/g.45301  ORF Transcript_17860/g.45301 Transcript_17860/m.45301 type:complete len:123 (+) Transcript_17860:309-677(+)
MSAPTIRLLFGLPLETVASALSRRALGLDIVNLHVCISETELNVILIIVPQNNALHQEPSQKGWNEIRKKLREEHRDWADRKVQEPVPRRRGGKARGRRDHGEVRGRDEETRRDIGRIGTPR